MFSLNDLGRRLETLTRSEQKIINARRKGEALCDLSDTDFEISLTGILFNISVISGIGLPTHDAYIKALEKEFSIFIKEFGYDNLTTEEILTAFRMNASFQLEEKIETYNQIFSIDYCSKVLSQYRDKRWSVDRKISEMHREMMAERELEKEAQLRREKAQRQFELFLESENNELDLSNLYMQLDADGAFAEKGASEYFLDKVELDERRIGQTDMQNILHNYWKNIDKVFQAEKECVKYLFKSMKETGRTGLYDSKWKLIHKGLQMPQTSSEIHENEF